MEAIVAYIRIYLSPTSMNSWICLGPLASFLSKYHQIKPDLYLDLLQVVSQALLQTLPNLPQQGKDISHTHTRTQRRKVSIIFKLDFCLANRNWLVLFPPPKRWTSKLKQSETTVLLCLLQANVKPVLDGAILLGTSSPLWFVAGRYLTHFETIPNCRSLLELNGSGAMTCDDPKTCVFDR